MTMYNSPHPGSLMKEAVLPVQRTSDVRTRPPVSAMLQDGDSNACTGESGSVPYFFTRLGLECCVALLAFIEPLTEASRHDFNFGVATYRASQL